MILSSGEWTPLRSIFPLHNTDIYSNRFSSLPACFLHQNPSGRGGVERWRGGWGAWQVRFQPWTPPCAANNYCKIKIHAEGQISAWKGILPGKPALTQLTCEASIGSLPTIALGSPSTVLASCWFHEWALGIVDIERWCWSSGWSLLSQSAGLRFFSGIRPSVSKLWFCSPFWKLLH